MDKYCDDIKKCVICYNISKLQCSKCKSVNYCSKNCQKSHWIKHKNNCHDLNKPLPSSTLPFPKDGIMLSTMDIFYNECGGKDKLEGLTTTEVNDKFLKPLTLSSRLSYCEYLKQSSYSSIVGIAEVFISHAWKYKFLDVMNAIEYHFRDTPEIIIWFDLFSNNQHQAVDLDFNWWCNTFKSAIRDFGYTVMILAPWKDPIPLTRGWCLFELYCTIIMGAKFEIAMSKNHMDEFLNDIILDVQRQINKMLGNINVENSDCFKKEDLKAIKDVVNKEVGFHKVNGMIFEKLRNWMIEVTRHAASETESDDIIRRMHLINACGGVYEQQGKYDDAMSCYKEYLEISKQILGDRSPNYSLAVHNCASISFKQGKYDEAEKFYVESLDLRRQILGDKHRDTLATWNGLAYLYSCQKRYDIAEKNYIDCLDLMKQALDTSDEIMHTNYLAAINNYSILLSSQGKFREAEPLCIQSLELRRTLLGDRHPMSLTALHNLGDLYLGQNRLTNAEPLLLKCLDLMTQVLGIDSPSTLISMNTCATLYTKQKKYDAAETLLVKCLNLRKQVLGDFHPETLKVQNDLIRVRELKSD